MSNVPLCRVCLKGNTKTYSVANTSLQVMYEKLTNNKLDTKDGKPKTVCSICLWNLRNCYKFKEKFDKSGDILKQLSQHGIEILPETLSAMKKGIQQDFCVTSVTNYTYGSQYGNIPIKKENENELEPDLCPAVEDLGPDAKLCRVCLSVSTKTYNKLGQLEVLYEKISDSKLSSTSSVNVICYLCRARLQRCKELVLKALKSEKILTELARNGIQLSQETVNILNRKIESRFTTSSVDRYSYNPNDTKSVIIKEEKESKAVETSETIIKQEVERNYGEREQNCEDIGQQFDRNWDDLGQTQDSPAQNVEATNPSGVKSDQSGVKPDQIGVKSDQSGDKPDQSGVQSEQIGDESEQIGDASEQNGDKPQSSDDHGQTNKEADLNCGKIGDNCKVCKANLNSQDKVERHKRLHDPRREFACNKCSYRYKTKNHLQCHKRTHRYNDKCEECGKSFRHKRLLKRHMWLHKGKVYKCRICDAFFRYGHQISKHNLAKHPEVDYDCKFCKMAFTAEHRLFEHVFGNHTREFPYFTCDYCRKKFTHWAVLRKHMILVHLKSFKHKCDKCRRYFSKSASLKVHKKICSNKVEIFYKCKLCPKSYPNKNNLIRHEIIHTGERNFKCDICDKTFRDKYGLKDHLRYHNPASLTLICDFCEKSYLNKQNFQEHVMTHITGIKKPYSCDNCCMNFSTKYEIQRHIMNKHSENPIQKPKLECKICNKKVVSLKDHMRIHSDKLYTCDLCDKTFRCRQYLISHTKSHSKEKPFVCDECGNFFASKAGLKNHILNIHTDRAKPHVCMLCDKAFGTSIQLKVHTRTHTGEKPFKCDKCHRKFCDLRGLQLHKIREHSNVKKTNYICDLCHKVCLEKKDIISHLKTHKGKSNFRCSVCNKSFLDMVIMFWHLEVHKKKSVEKHLCMFCKQSFSTKLSLNRHYFSSHDGYKEFACNICEEGFMCYRTLSAHIQISHKAGYTCSFCLNNYSRRTRLFRHFINVHGLKQK